MPDLVGCYGNWPCTTTRMLTICSWCDSHRSEGVNFLIDYSQSPIVRKIVEIEDFALRAAILDECQIY